MKFLRKFIAVLATYEYSDRLLSIAAVALFLGMIVKMILFPYGIFSFGESGIYTEGVVSRNGIQNINPLFTDYNEADREVAALVFSGLMKYDPETRTVVDDMATLTISEDKMKYTFELREGIKWSDGQPFTVDDVFFTFQNIVMHQSFQNEILKTNFAGVVIEKIDERKISFTLEKPNVFFINNFTVGILPKHVLNGVDPYDLLQDPFNKKPVGTGPYMVVDPAEAYPDGRTQITLQRNPNYYANPSEVEFMRFVAYPTMDQLVEEVNAVNGVAKVSGRYILDFENNERFELIPFELPQYTAVFMNMDSPILKERLVRLGLQKAIDKKALLAGAPDKIGVDTPLMELDQGDWIYQSNLEQAQGALKEAGFSYQPEDTERSGIRYNSSEVALELKFLARLYDEGSYQAEETEKVVEYLRGVWENIGVGLTVEYLPAPEFNEAVMARSYDLLLVGQILGYNLDTYSYWHSTQASPLGQNLSNYKSFQVDKTIEGIRSTFDKETKELRLAELAEKLKEDVPAIFLYRPVYYYASDGKVDGISMDGVVYPSDRFAGIWNWKFTR